MGFVQKLPEELRHVMAWATGGEGKKSVCIEVLEQGWGTMQFNCDLLKRGPLNVAGQVYPGGFGAHAPSRIRIRLDEPLRRFRAVAGVNRSVTTLGVAVPPEVVFRVEVGGRVVFESVPVTVHSPAIEVQADLGGALEFDLVVTVEGSWNQAHVDWCMPEVETCSGDSVPLSRPVGGVVPDSCPIDFHYDGMDARAFFLRYGTRREVLKKEDHTLLRIFSGGIESALLVTVEIKIFNEFPIAELHLAFENPSSRRSGILSDVDSIAVRWNCPDPDGAVLTRGHGSYGFGLRPADFRNSFLPVSETLEPGKKVRFGGVDGRPSVEWMPDFDLSCGETNLRVAVGWAGQWKAEIEYARYQEQVTIRAGIEAISTRLEPGERIELPSILLQWNQEGGRERGINLYRRFLREKICPRIDGVPVVPPLCTANWGGMRESDHLERIANIVEKKFPFECHWIDAGWYGPAGSHSPDEFDPLWSSTTGDWVFNPAILPEGLRNIAAASHAAGMKQLLWMEPERVVTDAKVFREHPEWFLRSPAIGAGNALLNLGDPVAWQWCFDTISRIIEENSLDWLRQDFNLSPLEPWRKNDEPERFGIHEIRYVAGLYRLWRELRRKFPRLRIDNCASGGRRLTFELMRYSLPLWSSDMECIPGFDPEWQITHVAGLSEHLPLFSFGVQNQEGGDTYNFRASMGPGLVVHFHMYEYHPLSEPYPEDWLHERLAEYLRARECFYGDYYRGSAFVGDSGAWSFLQFDRPDLGRGVVTVFRGAASPYTEAEIRFRGVDPDKIYLVEDADGAFAPCRLSGAALAAGLKLVIPERRTARLIFYQALEADA